MADQSECWGWSWADTRICDMRSVWGLDLTPAFLPGSVSSLRGRPPAYHHPDQPLLREGPLGARVGAPALPRGAAPAGHPLDAHVARRPRLDGAGPGDAEGIAA